MFVGTWWSLMPPIIAILLALLTKEVYLSLFAGCALGALLVAEFHPWVAFDTLFNTMIDSVDFSILMFMILLVAVVLIVGALTFFPALALGPILEHLLLYSGSVL